MPRSDPFQGLNLTENTPASTSRDSRLFASPPPKPDQDQPASQPSPRPDIQLSAQPVNREGVQPETEAAAQPTAFVLEQTAEPAAGRAPFDLAIPPARKATFYLTRRESQALEDLKIHIERTYDLPVLKTDLFRIGLYLLLDDHAQHGSQSAALRALQKRYSR